MVCCGRRSRWLLLGWSGVVVCAQLLLLAQSASANQITPGFRSSQPGNERVLLQSYGTADAVERFDLYLEDGVSPTDIEYMQSSSETDVLVLWGTDNILASLGPKTVNFTTTLSFDGMVGSTEYTLAVRRKGSKTILHSISIKYTIVGMSFYLKAPGESKKVISGDGSNPFTISYQDAMKKELTGDTKVYVFIQYADGKTSASLPMNASSLEYGATLVSSVVAARAQFNHSASLCDISAIGSYSPSNGLSLPDGCGFGFYRDEKNELCFGYNFVPYRSGRSRLYFSWSGLTATYEELAEETFESTFICNISGTPPVVVVDFEPKDYRFRYEGGESANVTFFNGDILNATDYKLIVGDSYTCDLVEGSLRESGPPLYIQFAEFVVAPGSGQALNITLEYKSGGRSNSTAAGFEKAVMSIAETLSYDEKMLVIDSITPESAKEEGGSTITLTGYFAGFRPGRDHIYFTGFQIQMERIQQWSSSGIAFELPPKADIGTSFEYDVSVKVGWGTTNKSRFFYLMTSGVLRISQSGTSQISNDTYRVGDCTPLKFTAVVEPLTLQIEKYAWRLASTDSAEHNLLLTKNELKQVDASLQTIEMLPEQIGITGDFILGVTVTLAGVTLHTDITLKRENVVNVGAFILEPPVRTLTVPDSPLRLTAIVKLPGACYFGGQGMRYEWDFLNKTMPFSPQQARTEMMATISASPTRLGRELVVPRSELKTGNHTVTFKVWMSNQTTVAGVAEAVVQIKHSSLCVVIRHGESDVEVNTASDLVVFGTNSYDPDVKGENRSTGLTYLWECGSASTREPESWAPCGQDLLPDAHLTSPSFSISKDVLQSLGNVEYVVYNLTVAKPGREEQKASQYIKITKSNAKRLLTNYTLTLRDVEGNQIPRVDVPTYEQVYLYVTAPEGIAWTYDMHKPTMTSFQFNQLLIESAVVYSPFDDQQGSTGSRKPLGIDRNKLSAFTWYSIRVVFLSSDQFQATEALFSFKTAEWPRLGLLNPLPSTGTTETEFTANAGISQREDKFAYYFFVTDMDGNEVCVGGCTGYDVVHFRIMRPGTYTFSASLYDKRGNSLLDQKTLPAPIVVTASGQEKRFQSDLQDMFLNGDDSAWMQLANDMSICVVQEPPEPYALDMILGQNATLIARFFEDEDSHALRHHILKGQHAGIENGVLSAIRQTASTAETLASQVANERLQARLAEKREEIITYLARGLRLLMCSSSPNTKYGRLAVKVVTRLLSTSNMDKVTLFNSLYVVLCSIENAPSTTAVDLERELPVVIAHCYRHAENIDAGGLSRQKLLVKQERPGSLVADIVSIVGRLMVRASLVGKRDDTQQAVAFGDSGEYGHIKLFVGSVFDQLPPLTVNGILRNGLEGRSKNEVFYILSEQAAKVSAKFGNKRRYMALYTTPNFVVKSGLQDAPAGANLGDNLYWVQIYEDASRGGIQGFYPEFTEPCFCMRLPVQHYKHFLNNSLGLMPGMFACRDWKRIGVVAKQKGEFYNYAYHGMKVVEYNVREGWVEACHTETSLFGATAITMSTSQVIALEKALVLGQQGVIIVGFVVGGLALAVVAIAASWLIVTRASAKVPAMDAEPSPTYLERDIYGRGTILDASSRARRA